MNNGTEGSGPNPADQEKKEMSEEEKLFLSKVILNDWLPNRVGNPATNVDSPEASGIFGTTIIHVRDQYSDKNQEGKYNNVLDTAFKNEDPDEVLDKSKIQSVIKLADEIADYFEGELKKVNEENRSEIAKKLKTDYSEIYKVLNELRNKGGSLEKAKKILGKIKDV